MKVWFAWAGACAALAGAATPVEVHGRLSVEGNRIVDDKGDPADLRGMSMFWSNWSGRFWNERLVQAVREDWKVSVLRAAMGVEPDNGYLAHPTTQEARVRSFVDAAIANGLYVIVDWHDHNAQDHRDQAIDFFRRMARDYGKYPNVIWEIFNEPERVEWGVVKGYAGPVIDAIRAEDPDNLIVVGTPEWSAKVDLPADDPITGSNIAYTLHFYAASHDQWLRDRADYALSKGVALFATEWGTCEYSGTGRLDAAETANWLAWMDDRHISWANWSLNDKAETCSALQGGASSYGTWNDANLSASGRIVRAAIRERNTWYDDFVVRKDTVAVPGTILGSSSSDLEGPRLEASTDGSSRHLAYIDDGAAASWTLRADRASHLSTTLRTASANEGGSVRWLLDGAEVARSSVSGTGGWESWKEQPGPSFSVPSGVHVLRLEFSGAGTGLFNLDAIAVSAAPLAAEATAPRAPAWHRDGNRVWVEGAAAGTARLLDAGGRLLDQAPVRDGRASLTLPVEPGVRLLVLPGQTPRLLPAVR
ncbi:MAG: cellulase family glycosylhydrolase [Fibrobacteria bacterium]|nr:cellulase family glycosylhydrolase [Fibrobacteria bacterium]